MNTTCKECGCTDERGCVGGCFWVAPGLCSKCAIAGLRAAGMDPHPLEFGLHQWRAAGYVQGDDHSMQPVMVPLALLSAAMDCLNMWAVLVRRRSIACPNDTLLQVQAVSEQTQSVVAYWDKLAAGACVPSIEEMQTQIHGAEAMAAADASSEPEPPRLWRPGDDPNG